MSVYTIVEKKTIPLGKVFAPARKFLVDGAAVLWYTDEAVKAFCGGVAGAEVPRGKSTASAFWSGLPEMCETHGQRECCPWVFCIFSSAEAYYFVKGM